MRAKHLATALLCLVTLAHHPRVAFGDDPSDAEKRAVAEEIFSQGNELMTQRNFSAACPKFEEVVNLQPNGIGARMTLGDCYTAQRKFASAHTTYTQVASMALLANQPDRANIAKDKAAALGPKVSKLMIVVPPEVAGLSDLTIMRGGLVVTASLFNVAVPVDGGVYTVVADAMGRKPFTQAIEVADEGAKEQVIVAFEAAPSGEQVPSREDSPALADAPVISSGMHPVRVGGIVVGSIGLALAGVGVGVGVARSSAAEDYREQHDAPDTSEADQELLNDAFVAAGTEANVGWALTAIGGAATIAGLVMVIAAPSGDGPANVTKTDVSVGLHMGPSSLWLRVAF